jgi:sterol desaturase/sphingolipid hydroxylase (fatty acid hydroxylase superfamily)
MNLFNQTMMPHLFAGDISELAPSEHARLIFLLVAFGIVFLFETAVPLFNFGKDHLRHTIRNLAITAIFVGVNLLVAPISPFVTGVVTHARFGLSYWLGFGALGQLALGLAGLDLFAYFAHLTMHEFGWLWRFHRMHHSDAEVDVTTAFREHPGETAWRIGWHLAGVVAFGVPLWMLVIYLTLSAFNAQLEHANIRIPATMDRWLRVLYVTPNMHKVHHSRTQPETDMNYSNLLSLWDRLGRTYSRGPQFDELRYGLDSFDHDEMQSVRGMLRMPFVNSWGNGPVAIDAIPVRKVA